MRETSKHFNIAVSTIQDWEKLLCEKGALSPIKPNRQPKKLPPDELKRYIEEHPDAYQSEIAEAFGCVQSAVNKALKRLKITHKKTIHYEEQDYDKVAMYKYEISDIPPENIVYVDESAMETYLYREYGYAPRGEKVYDSIKGRKYARVGIIAAQMGNRIIAPFEYTGTMNHKLFEVDHSQ